MSDWTKTGALVLGSVTVLYIGRRALGPRRSYPLPPGPPGLPWIGTVSGIDAGSPWITYNEWAKTYGRLKHVGSNVHDGSRHSEDRQLDVFSTVWTRHHHPQFRKDCQRSTREPVQELFGPSVPLHQRHVGSFASCCYAARLISRSRCGLGFISVFLPYGDRWRLHRRFFHQTFGPEAVHRFLPPQHRKTCQLLRQLLDAPEQLDDHVFE